MLFKLKAIKAFLRLISLGEQIVKMPKQTGQLSELQGKIHTLQKQG